MRIKYIFTSILLLFLLELPAILLAGVKCIKLDNGMRVILDEDHRAHVIAMQLWVKAGSADETGSCEGISHFIEHMAFKGTEKYGLNEMHSEVEKRGGLINAGTARDFTYFYITLPSNIGSFAADTAPRGKPGAVPALSAGLDIIYQAACRPVFPEDEFNREKKVILEEIKRKQDDPQGCLWDIFNSVLYNGGAYAGPVLGNTSTVGGFTPDDISGFYKRFYGPGNFVLVVAGDFSENALLKQVRSSFGREKTARPGARAGKTAVTGSRGTAGPKTEKNVFQAYIMLGAAGPDGSDADAYPMDVLACIMGKGRASRLFRVLKEEKELAWEIGCSFSTQRYKGPFYIYAECETTRMAETRAEIERQLKKITEEKVTDEEMLRAKAMIESEFLLGTETLQGAAFNMGYYEVIGSYKLGLSYIKNILKVTREDVQRVAKKYLSTEDIVCAVIAPQQR